MRRINRERLNAYPARCTWPRLGTDGDHEDEAAHFYRCEACGQAVDMRRLGDVFHHEEADHEPIPADA